MKKVDVVAYTKIEFVRYYCPYCKEENNLSGKYFLELGDKLFCLSCKRRFKIKDLLFENKKVIERKK